MRVAAVPVLDCYPAVRSVDHGLSALSVCRNLKIGSWRRPGRMDKPVHPLYASVLPFAEASNLAALAQTRASGTVAFGR